VSELESLFRIPVVVATSDEGPLNISYNGSLNSNVMFNIVNCLKHIKYISTERFGSLFYFHFEGFTIISLRILGCIRNTGGDGLNWIQTFCIVYIQVGYILQFRPDSCY
jgi:hypothetical protein